MTNKQTDWDKYYKKPKSAVRITRSISTNKIHNTICKHIPAPPESICELGGANSCFLSSFLKSTSLKSYHIIDLNSYGLSLLVNTAKADSRLSYEENDILSINHPGRLYDLVYSVGLIEHFSIKDTEKSIESHFKLCKPGGYVLITFPTPTWLYQVARKLAEIIKVWQFQDERPLCFNEVLNTCGKYGELIHRSINWKIVFTQGYVLYRKNGT